MSDTDWRVSTLIKTAADHFEGQSKAIQAILDEAREKFRKDHTGTTASIGIGMILAAFVFAFLGKSPSFCLAGLGLGCATLLVALLFRHRSADRQISYSKMMIELEKERAQFATKQAVLTHIWLHGLPEGTPLAQIQMLMGDRPSVPPSSENTWRQLPPVAEAKEAEDGAEPAGGG